MLIWRFLLHSSSCFSKIETEMQKARGSSGSAEAGGGAAPNPSASIGRETGPKIP